MSGSYKNISILVVDDTAPMRQLLISVLKTLGIENIEYAVDGREGFHRFCKIKPDLVISDWEMSPEDGLKLVYNLRRNPVSPNRMVPVLLLSGYSARKRVSQARDAGATEYLAKPFSVHDLAMRIEHMVLRPRKFVDNLPSFFGPSRRRKREENYAGPFRRTGDAAENAGAEPDRQEQNAFYVD